MTKIPISMYSYAIAGYAIGMLLYSLVTILKIKNEYPAETLQIKIFRTYWVREWAAFLVSMGVGLAYVFALDQVVGFKIFDHAIGDFVKLASVSFGVGGQWIGIAICGVTRKVVSQKASQLTGDPTDETK